MPDRTSQPDQPPMRASASDRVARASARAQAAAQRRKDSGGLNINLPLSPAAAAALAALAEPRQRAALIERLLLAEAAKLAGTES